MATSHQHRLQTMIQHWQDELAALQNNGTAQELSESEYELAQRKGQGSAYEIALDIASGRPAPNSETLAFIRSELVKRLEEAQTQRLNAKDDLEWSEWFGTGEAYRHMLESWQSYRHRVSFQTIEGANRAQEWIKNHIESQGGHTTNDGETYEYHFFTRKKLPSAIRGFLIRVTQPDECELNAEDKE